MQERLRALTVLWRRALSGPPHAAGCSCFGGFMMTAPTPRELEEDVLDYLRHRYLAVDADIAARLLAREQALRSGVPPDFPGFLAALVAAVPAASDRVLNDVEATLTSLAGPAPGASRFACT